MVLLSDAEKNNYRVTAESENTWFGDEYEKKGIFHNDYAENNK